MRWAVAYHPDQIETWQGRSSRLIGHPMRIPESSLPVARAQGWIVLGTDSDVYARVDANANVQRNPNRSADTGED